MFLCATGTHNIHQESIGITCCTTSLRSDPAELVPVLSLLHFRCASGAQYCPDNAAGHLGNPAVLWGPLHHLQGCTC